MSSQDRATEILEQGQEPFTGFTTIIGSDHAYIHKGIGFKGIINTGAISTAYNIGITTPSVASGLFLHWRPASLTSSANNVTVTLYEGDTFTGGTTVTPINLNRNSDNTSETQAFAKSVTSTPVGVVISATQIGTEGNAASRSGGGTGAAEERVLKPNTSYVMQFVPDGETTVITELFWYEEEKGL